MLQNCFYHLPQGSYHLRLLTDAPDLESPPGVSRAQWVAQCGIWLDIHEVQIVDGEPDQVEGDSLNTRRCVNILRQVCAQYRELQQEYGPAFELSPMPQTTKESKLFYYEVAQCSLDALNQGTLKTLFDVRTRTAIRRLTRMTLEGA